MIGVAEPSRVPLWANLIDVFKLTRELIDIPSVTGGEFEVGNPPQSC